MMYKTCERAHVCLCVCVAVGLSEEFISYYYNLHEAVVLLLRNTPDLLPTSYKRMSNNIMRGRSKIA